MDSTADKVKILNKETVALRTGPPTKEELVVHYPAKFTWEQLKTFVNSGDLGLLKRDRKLQKRYDDWAVDIVKQHGSMVAYLVNRRLRWGERDTSSLLTSALQDVELPTRSDDIDDDTWTSARHRDNLNPPYFCWETPKELISIIQNDWPYSVPPEIEHTLIWTKAPIYHPDLVHPSIKPRIDQDGLWGFTGLGLDSPPPSPSLLPSCLPALEEWGITEGDIVASPRATREEEEMVRRAGREVQGYVMKRWREEEWETAWFVNPPRLQSVPGLAHVHVFARRK